MVTKNLKNVSKLYNSTFPGYLRLKYPEGRAHTWPAINLRIVFLSEPEMQSMKYLFVSVIPLFSMVASHAQSVESTPVQFLQFFNTHSIINPASCSTVDDVVIDIGKQRHSGIWRNISTTFASGSLRLRPNSKSNNFHSIGLTFVNDKEGEYLRRSKVYLNYGWHTKLTKNLSLAAGTAVGYYSYVVSASTANVAGADNAPDASIGMWLYNDEFYVGASINQLLNSSLVPLEEETKLVRHYNLSLGYFHEHSASFSLEPKAMVRFAPNHPVEIDLAVVGVIRQLIGLGVGYRYQKGFVGMFGVEQLKFGNSNLKAMFSYGVPLGRISANVQTYELTVGYGHSKKKKKNKKK